MVFLEKAKKLNSEESGFTLIELIVAMAVFILLTGIVIGTDREGQRARALDGSAQAATSSVREAMNMAMGGRAHHGSTPPAYGVYFAQGADRIIIFADCNESRRFHNNPLACSGETEISRIHHLRENVTIQSVSPCFGSPCALHVTFYPPYPDVHFLPSAAGGEVVLTTETNDTVSVEINRLGVTTIVQD